MSISTLNCNGWSVHANEQTVDKFSLTAKENIFYLKNKFVPHGNADNWIKAEISNSITSSSTKSNDNTNNNGMNISDTDYEMMCYIVQAEVGYCSEQSKIAVTNVILNRVKDSRFPNTISGVLTQKNQFASISNYYNRTKKPTDNTKKCVERTLKGEDNSKGALYFYNPKYCSYSVRQWFESLYFCFELDGQRYFKN